MNTIPFHQLPLENMPVLIQAGLCLHGARAVESHCQRGLWSLHAYHYSGTLHVTGTTHAFQPGWVSLIPPGVDAEWHFPPHAPHYYAHFKASRSVVGTPVLLLIDLVTRSVRFCELLDEMVACFPEEPRRASVRLWDLLFQLAAPVSETRESAPFHPHLQIALSLIRNNPSEKLLVAAMARKMGVSSNHLTQIFQRQFGCGVRQYIRKERINRACELLRQTSLQVKSIAIECGFGDLQYFNKVIRKATGASPREYRQRSRAAHPCG